MISELNEKYKALKLLESQLAQRRARFMTKLPGRLGRWLAFPAGPSLAGTSMHPHALSCERQPALHMQTHTICSHVPPWCPFARSPAAPP